MVPLAIGSQTNGSVIRPAAFCGVYGVKPTHGTISRHGALILSQALDHVGVFARTLADAALILDVLAGYDANDPDSRVRWRRRRFSGRGGRAPAAATTRLRAHADLGQGRCGARAAFEELVRQLGDAATVDLPDAYAAAWDDQRVIMATDMAHNFGALVARGGERPASNCAIWSLRAVRPMRCVISPRATALCVTRRDRRHLKRLRRDPDAVGARRCAERHGDRQSGIQHLWTLAGLPAVSLPLLKGEGGMPIGVQLVGAFGNDARLLRTANWLAGILAAA